MSYEAFREQCAKVAEAMPKFSTNGSEPVQDRIAEKIRAMPLPESSIQHKNMICMSECMDMVRSELIEMGIIDISVPPMMIADAVGDKLKESTEAIRKENEQLRELLCLRSSSSTHLPYMDDGELQDNSAFPCIDYKRDSVAEIISKLQQRTLKELKGGAA